MNFKIYKVISKTFVMELISYALVINNCVVTYRQMNSNIKGVLLTFDDIQHIRKYPHPDHPTYDIGFVRNLVIKDIEDWDTLVNWLSDIGYDLCEHSTESNYHNWEFVECLFETTNINDIRNLREHLPEYYY